MYLPAPLYCPRDWILPSASCFVNFSVRWQQRPGPIAGKKSRITKIDRRSARKKSGESSAASKFAASSSAVEAMRNSKDRRAEKKLLKDLEQLTSKRGELKGKSISAY